MASKTTATSLEEHFRNVADVKELLRLAGLPMRATAVDAMLQMAAEGVSGGNNCSTQLLKGKEDCRDFSHAMEWLSINI